MAAGALLYKATLKIADMDAGYYDTHRLTLAQHPSETTERLMVRLLAFALYASDSLAFGRGLSTEDEPALWQRDESGHIELWIDVGLPDPQSPVKACRRAQQTVLLAYGRGADLWWHQHRGKLESLRNLSVLILPARQTEALAALAERNMALTCNIQESVVSVLSATRAVNIEPSVLMPVE